MPSSLGRTARFCAYAAALLLIVLGEDGARAMPAAVMVTLLVVTGATLLAITIRESARSRYYLATVPPLLLGAFLIHYCFGAIVVIVWDALPWTTLANRSAYDIHAVREYISSGAYLAIIGGLGLYAGSTIRLGLPSSRKHTDESDIRQLRPVAPALLAFCALFALLVNSRSPPSGNNSLRSSKASVRS